MLFDVPAYDDSGSVRLRTISFAGPDGVVHDFLAEGGSGTELIRVPTDSTWALGAYEIQSASAEDPSGNRTTYHRDGSVEYFPAAAGVGRPSTHSLSLGFHADFRVALPPDAPTDLVAEVDGDRVIKLSFAEPSDNGDRLWGMEVVSDPEGYQSIGGYSNPDYARFDRDHVGQTFTFTLYVSNGAGGSPSVTSNPVTVTGLAAPPIGVMASPGDRSATVSWQPSEPGWGQSPVDSYTVRTLPGGELRSVDATATQATVTGLTPGTPYQFQVAASNAAGDAWNWAASTEVTPYGDVEGPVATVTRAPSGFTTAGRVVLGWEGSDATGVADYDVRRRSARYDAGFGAWSVVRTSTSEKQSRFAVSPGRKHCFQVRARDTYGNLGQWSRHRCFVSAIDDRQMSARGWTRWSQRGNYRWTGTGTRTGGRHMVLDRVRARSLRLLVQKCPACGKVRVRYRGVDLGTFDLSAPTLRKRQIVFVKRFDQVLGGRLVITSATTGKPVRIDAVIAER